MEAADVEAAVDTQLARKTGTEMRDSKWQAICLVLYIAVCFVGMASPGWYNVSYRADGQEKCSLRLNECTLSACKDDIPMTGQLGEGTSCSNWHRALLMFLLAGTYTCLYLFYLIGGFHDRRKERWLDMNKKCCIDTGINLHSTPLSKAIPSLDKHRIPHGCLVCGTPILMTLGLIFFLMQDLTHYNGLPSVGLGPVFYIVTFFTVTSWVVCGWPMYKDKQERNHRDVDMGSDRSAAGAAGSMVQQDPIAAITLPASAPYGFSYFTPPNQGTVTIQTVEQLHEALRTTDQRTKITASSRICRVNVDQAWIVISAAPDFFSLYAVRAPMLTRAAPVLARP